MSPLGAGGMGEVYRARDTKLGRDVAVKIIPELFVTDPERVARFEREAQLLATLNHPNIAHVYGLEGRPPTRQGRFGEPRRSSPDITASEGGDRLDGQDGPARSFIVMEFVDGESLAQRLERQPSALSHQP